MFRISSFIPGRRFSRACLFLAAACAGIGLGRLGRNHFGQPSPARTLAGSGGLSQAGHGEAAPPVASRGHAGPTAMAVEAVSAGTAARLARTQGADYWLYLLAAAEEAPPELLARLLDALGDEPSAVTLLGRRWAQRDPSGMLAFLKSRPFSPQGDPYTPSASSARHDRSLRRLQEILAQEWGRGDPEALIAALSGREPKSSDLGAAKLETVRLLSGTDPGRTVDLMLAWELPLDSADGPALVSWAGAHPRQVAERLFLGGRDRKPGWDNERCLLLKETIKALAATDPRWALQIQQNQSGPAGSLFSTFSMGILNEWAQRDLPAAAAFLADDQNGLSRQRKDGLSQVLLNYWGAKDPAAALAWTNSQLTGPAKNRALGSLLRALAAVDSSQALDFIDRLPPGQARDGIFGDVVETILGKNDQPQAAATLRWMTALPDPIQRDTALKAGAGKLMETAPDEFIAWLNTPEGREQVPYEALRQTARILSKDPTKALEWAAGLRPEAAPPIRRQLIERWFWSDFDGPTAWIRHQPAGPARADSIISATTYLAQEDSAGKLQEWLNSLPASDYPAIAEGIQKAKGFDPEQKAGLLAKYRKP